MSQHTAAGVRRPSSVFQQGGLQWVPVPVGMDGPALDVWMAIMRVTRAGTTCTAPDHVLASLVGRCCRYVQQGLKALESAGMIERLRRRGGRVITVVARLAGRESTDSQRPRQSVSHEPPAPIRTPAPPPSVEGIQDEKSSGPSGAACTPSGPDGEATSPWTLRWFGRLFPETAPGNSSPCGRTGCGENTESVT